MASAEVEEVETTIEHVVESIVLWLQRLQKDSVGVMHYIILLLFAAME